MFDDLKIRNKLVLLVAGPIVIIVLLAALGARSRQDTAAASRNVEKLTALARSDSDVVDALQKESLYSTAFVGSDRKVSKQEMTTARKATDVAIQDALSRQSALVGSSASFRSASTLAADAADKLAYIRSAVDQGYRWDQVTGTYEALQSTFLEVNDAVATNLTDPQVANDLRTASALASYKATISQQGSTLVGASERGIDPRDKENIPATSTKVAIGDLRDMLGVSISDESVGLRILNSFADKARKGDIRDALTSDSRGTFEDVLKDSFDDAKLATFAPKSATVSDATIGVLADLHKVEVNLYNDVIARAQHTRSRAERAANLFILAAALAILVAIGAAVLLGRRITRPLNHLTEAADRLSSEQMPRLVEWLRNPSEDEMAFELGSLTPIEVESNDEIGRLANSFNDVQRVAGEVAAEQAALLRKGIGEMFVNLARRNQALLDRQIDFIDELERGEEDPDQLENLYRLDHLATRMRRNAESLLVLAGAEPPRRRGRPAPLANVVRAALAEVEDFGRIDLLSFDEILVASNVAADLAHLLSELMENATNFSPPETRVEVVGHRTKADGYMISVTDHGIGMSSEQIAEANDSLAKPPLVGLALSRSLGFIVVGRLSGRHGVTVRMMPSPSGGVTAVVSIPANLITDTPGLSPDVPDARPERSALPEPSPLRPPSEEALQPAASSSTPPPLAFTPSEVLSEPAASAPPLAPTGPVARPVSAAPSTDPATGLPNRRAKQEDAGLPARRSVRSDEAAAAEPAPEAPAAARVELPEAIVFADPNPVDVGPEVEEHAARLDGPPPPAPVLPARAAPARTPVATPPLPGGDGESKPFFLEESQPPRLFGRRAESGEAVAPAAAAEPPAAAPVAPAAPRRVAPADRNGTVGVATETIATETIVTDVVTTTSGLAKRTPRQGGASRAIPGADAGRGVGATRRSPEEVRNLLSGFRAGQQRARTEESVPTGSPEDKDGHE